MKVISQLIKHFWQRGVLSSGDANYLVEHGFVRGRDLPGYAAPPELHEIVAAADEPPSEDSPLEQMQETLVRRAGKRRKSGESRGDTLTDAQVCERLRGEFARRADDLQVLVRLSQQFEPYDDWMEAVSFLHQVGYNDFCTALETAWTRHYVTFRDVWQAVELESFHRLVSDDEMRGRSARAFSALLVVHDAAELGKYAWILKHDEIQAVNNLRVLHQRLMAHLKHLYLYDVRLLGHIVAQGCDLTAFWTLILLHNAHRRGGVPHTTDLNSAPAPLEMGFEYGPLALPDESVWKAAWTAALEIDRAAVTKLLAACYRQPSARGARSTAQHDWPLYCPAGWHEPDAEPILTDGSPACE